MNRSRTFLCCNTLLLLACAGCSRTIAVVGYSSAEPHIETKTSTKQWRQGLLHAGWEVEGWLGDECTTNMTAWCDSTGGWGIANDITNRADEHMFTTIMVFGHVDGGNFNNFVEIARHSTAAATVGKNEERCTSASRTMSSESADSGGVACCDVAGGGVDTVGAANDGEGRDTNDANIASQFDRINAILPIVVMRGGIDQPLGSGNIDTVSCTLTNRMPTHPNEKMR